MLRELFSRLGFRFPQPETALPFEPFAGQLVSVVTEEGDFAVMKLLVVDDGGVHARLYVQRFRTRPTKRDLGRLDTAPFGPDHDNPFSIGHVPLSFRSFAAWSPELIRREEVRDDELEGYKMWQEAEAGYF